MEERTEEAPTSSSTFNEKPYFEEKKRQKERGKKIRPAARSERGSVCFFLETTVGHRCEAAFVFVNPKAFWGSLFCFPPCLVFLGEGCSEEECIVDWHRQLLHFEGGAVCAS